MSENAYIEIAYKDNGRVVEGPCSHMIKFVVCGLAKPRTGADGAKLTAWMDALDDEGRDSVLVAAEKVRPKRQWKRGRSDDDGDDEGSEEAEADDDRDVEAESSSEESGDDETDGWPEGVTYDRKGSYFELTGSDGKRIESDTRSGKFNGEDAAQEAAWKYEAALKRG